MCHYLRDFAQRTVTGISSVFHFTEKNIKFKTKECRYSRARVILEHGLCVFHAILRVWLKELYPRQCRVWLELYPRQCRVWLKELYPWQCRVWLELYPRQCRRRRQWLMLLFNVRVKKAFHSFPPPQLVEQRHELRARAGKSRSRATTGQRRQN